MTTVYIALGSNIDPEKNLQACADLLRQQWSDIRFSNVYKSSPQLHEDQDDFLNACATFETEQSPEEIARTIVFLEQKLAKKTLFEYGPRNIDLDLLLYGDDQGTFTIYNLPFTIPHKRMHERRFVLAPLCELIDPTKTHPTLNQTWQSLLEQVQEQQQIAVELHL